MAILVNGERIEDEAIREEAERMRPAYEKAFADEPTGPREAQLQQWGRENLIERTVLTQAAMADPEPLPADRVQAAFEDARSRGHAPQDSDDTLRARIERELRIDRLLERTCADLAAPSDEIVRQYYEEHQRDLIAPERAHAAQIVRGVTPLRPPEVAEAELREVHEQLGRGADFAEMAARHSDLPDGGGVMGWFPRGQMPPALENVVWSLAPGETSHVFATRLGFHIVRLHERRPAGARRFDEVEDAVREVLAGEMQHRAIEEYIDGLTARAKVEDA